MVNKTAGSDNREGGRKLCLLLRFWAITALGLEQQNFAGYSVTGQVCRSKLHGGMIQNESA